MLVPRRPGWDRHSAPLGLEGNAEAALGVLDRAAAARAVVVGHSLGAAVAAWLGAAHADRIAALILVAPSANTKSLVPLDHVLAAPVVGDLLCAASLAGAGTALAADVVRRATCRWLQVDPGYLRSSARLLLEPATWRAFAAEQRMLVRELPLLEERLAAITSPTTIVAGAADRIVPLQSARRLSAQIPGASLTVLDHGHHLLHQQRPREVAEIIARAAAGS